MLAKIKLWVANLLGNLQRPRRKLLPKTASDSDLDYAREVVDTVFLPVLQKQLEILNGHLSTKGLRAGIDIRWFFDRLE